MLKYGQCTRYLANLRPGSKVTVSIKPSVMKVTYTSDVTCDEHH